MNPGDIQNRPVLFLGPPDPELTDWIEHRGNPVIRTTEKITPGFIDQNRICFIVSCGYRHILPGRVLEKLPDRTVNLHISYLPWNRGADPNFWSFADKTKKGVTIHYMDYGIDTGDIIVQEELFFNRPDDTLATTYHQLKQALSSLFKEHWDGIKTGTCPRTRQPAAGSFHGTRDKTFLWEQLPLGWDTPVSVLENLTDPGYY
jgi:methionyl-tRNA formyltransferase